MADKQKTGRIVGTAAAAVLVASIVAIIFMATRPNPPTNGDTGRGLLPPPGIQAQGQ